MSIYRQQRPWSAEYTKPTQELIDSFPDDRLHRLSGEHSSVKPMAIPHKPEFDKPVPKLNRKRHRETGLFFGKFLHLKNYSPCRMTRSSRAAFAHVRHTRRTFRGIITFTLRRKRLTRRHAHLPGASRMRYCRARALSRFGGKKCFSEGLQRGR